MNRIALFAVLTLATSGCATILDGTTQTVTVMPMQAGAIQHDATCTLTNRKGSWVASAGQPISVKKSRDDLLVSCVDNTSGQQAAGVGTRATKIGYAFANFFIWDLCTFSCAIDFGTGSIYAYPPQIQLQMPLDAAELTSAQ